MARIYLTVLLLVLGSGVSHAECGTTIECVNKMADRISAYEDELQSLTEKLKDAGSTDIEIYDTGWFDFSTGKSKNFPHKLGDLPHGFTIYFRAGPGAVESHLVDTVSYITEGAKGGVGVFITDVTADLFIVRAGRHRLFSSYPVLIGADRLTEDEGQIKVIAWIKKR